jgi:ribosome-associated heat shock protein Hsp15
MSARAEAVRRASVVVPPRQRIDKWLWAARFYKTRSLATQAIEAGQVRLDSARIKPAHDVRIGDRVGVRKGGFAWEVEVTALSERRGNAADAARLYCETAQSAEARKKAIEERKAALAAEPRWGGRPTKRDRRKLEDFLNEP